MSEWTTPLHIRVGRHGELHRYGFEWGFENESLLPAEATEMARWLARNGKGAIFRHFIFEVRCRETKSWKPLPEAQILIKRKGRDAFLPVDHDLDYIYSAHEALRDDTRRWLRVHFRNDTLAALFALRFVG